MDDENQPFLSNIYNPSSGFTITGKPCSSFNGSSGSDDCPFQVQTTWKRFCLSGSCTNGDLPGVEVYIDFIFKPKKYPLVALNSDLLSIQVVKSGLSGGESVLYNKTIRDTNNGYTINTVGNTWYGYINGVSMTDDNVCMTIRDISESLNMSQRSGWVTVSASTETQLAIGKPFASVIIICIDSYCTVHKAASAAGEPIYNSDSRSLPLAKRSYPYNIRVIHRPFYIEKVNGPCTNNMLNYPRTNKTFVDITVFRRD